MTWTRYFYCLLCGLFVASAEIKSVSVTEGDSVTLNTNFTEEQISVSHIFWTFINTSGTQIAEIFQQKVILHDETEAERFRGHLNLDLQTGSLAINHINKSHAGLYKVQIMDNGRVKHKTFRVSVLAHCALPVPIIRRDSSLCSSSRCLLWCSAGNVSDATLSWFIGSSEISSIHLNAENLNCSLPLEVEQEDENIYKCVLNHRISRKTHSSSNSVLCLCSDSKRRTYWLTTVIISVFLLFLCLITFGLCRQKQARQGAQITCSNRPELGCPAAHSAQTRHPRVLSGPSPASSWISRMCL